MKQYTSRNSGGRSDWCVSLDPTTWTFVLCKSGVEETTIKYLKTSALCKFMKRIKCCKKMRTKSDGDYLNCFYCKKWFDGFCVKHPLIFVQEPLPVAMPYNCDMTVPEFLKISHSSMACGKGVFACSDLPRGLTFGPYAGKLSYTCMAQKSGYSWQLGKPSKSQAEAPVVDAYSATYSNWMRYVNCARYEEEQNLIALFYKNNIYYTIYKPIRRDDELLIWYGSSYGQLLFIRNAASAVGATAPKRDRFDSAD